MRPHTPLPTRRVSFFSRHYRAGLNMIPLIEWYRRHPEEGTFLLEVSMGAMAGQLVNIDLATGCERTASLHTCSCEQASSSTSTPPPARRP